MVYVVKLVVVFDGLAEDGEDGFGGEDDHKS
jgi:hypothetical protein